MLSATSPKFTLTEALKSYNYNSLKNLQNLAPSVTLMFAQAGDCESLFLEGGTSEVHKNTQIIMGTTLVMMD